MKVNKTNQTKSYFSVIFILLIFLSVLSVSAQVFQSSSDTVFKDENGKVISQAEFMQKQKSGEYGIEPEIVNGKIAAMKLKKGSGGNQPQVINVPRGAKIASVENTPFTEAVKKETFEKVWQTINEKYWDATFNGVDWNAVKTKYEPQLNDAKTNQDLIILLNKMLGEIKVSHLAVIPPDRVFSEQALPDNSKQGSIGITTRLLENSELVVISVREDSPAARAGIKNGFLIKKIDGQTIAEILAEQKKKGGFRLRDEITAVRAVTAKLLGNIDKKVSVTFIDEKDVEKNLEIERQNFGIALGANFESKQLSENVGYIKFNIFVGDLQQQFADAVAKMQNDKSLIVDLRGNRGGIASLTTAVAACLDKGKNSLGVSQFRTKKEQYDYEGNDKSFKGKVFILIDEFSGSAAEVLAGGLQANKRAVIIGQTSAGAVLPSTTESLPNGGALQYAIADFKTSDGKILEGTGVIPDVKVKLTRKDLLAGKDLFVETALNLAKR
ncbi:MAG: PDZ domain-containing protein [Pyrinomonadaceae bacterium]|nr:PDZ domain-containing protein [Pyrinomonadaceae bacterium]